MSVRLYMDHNVQGAVVDALRVRGVDCLTAQEDGTITLDDDSLLARATELGRVLVTHDKDFFTIFETWWSAGRTLAGIVQSLPTQITIGQLIEDLHFIAEAADPEEMQNSLIRLPL